MSLRILLLGPLPPPYGGPEVMTQALLDGLSRHPEFTIQHLNTQVSRTLAEKGGQHQARKSVVGAIHALRLLRRLLTFRPDVLYMPMTNSPSFLGFLRDAVLIAPALLLGKKFVIRMHSGHYFYAHRTGWQRRLVKALVGRACLGMVQGESLRGVFNGLIPDHRIAVVPNGLDDRPFAEARARRGARPSGARRRVLFVGILRRDKGLRDVVAAIPHVPDAEFVFLGEWPTAIDRDEVAAFVREQGIADRVNFAGVVTGPAKYDTFVSADIFVFPTYFPYEGHAVSSVEAIAAGLPIVCTRHGALDESVRDGWNGFFVPKSDPAALADRLNQLLADDDLRATFGQNSRQLYEERFTLEQYVENWAAAMHRYVAQPAKVVV